MPTRANYYKQLEECSQATRNRIYRRLQDRGGVRGLKFPTSRVLATALMRVKDGREVLAQERAVGELDEAGADDALDRLERLEREAGE